MLMLAGGVGYFLLEAGHQWPAPAASRAGGEPTQVTASLPPGQTVASAAPSPIKVDAMSALGDEGIPVVIVLPFQDLTGDNASGDLGKGIAEAS